MNNTKEDIKEWFGKNKVLAISSLFLVGIIVIAIFFRVVSQHFWKFISVEIILSIGLILIIVLNKKAKEMWKNLSVITKSFSAFMIIALIGSTVLIGTLDITLDGGDGVYIPENGNGNGDPPFDVPEVSLDSIIIEDLDIDSFTFRLFVTYRSSVSDMDIFFEVDGVDSYDTWLTSLSGGFYEKEFTKSQFSGITDDSIITIDIHMTYYHPNLGYSIDVPYLDVVEGFSFEEQVVEPTYVEPEIIEDTKERSPNYETERVSFSFLVSDFELVNDIYYHFVVDGDVVQDSTGNDIVTEMDVDANGKFSSSFDYTQFDLTKENWVYLTMNFENEDGDNEDKDYNKYFPFQYGEPTPTPTPTNGYTPPTNGTGINPMFAIVAMIMSLGLCLVIRKKVKK